MEIWIVYTLCCIDLKRAPLTDIFFGVKNMTKMKYHADVIHSITQTLSVIKEKYGHVIGEFVPAMRCLSSF